jgi:hypothetical protein
MMGNWETELRKLKQQPIRETKMKKQGISDKSHKTEFRRLMKLVEAQLLPVVEVFREENLTKTMQPHIHEYKNGYTLVVPVAEPGIKPLSLKLEFELMPTETGHVMKVIRETPKEKPAPEIIVESPITEEKIRDEIRAFLCERQNVILKIKK